MSLRPVCACLILFGLLLLPFSSPAPLIYRPGEGWSYEPVGGETKWRRARAKEQLDVAQKAFDEKEFSLALRAARRVVTVWPLSDYAPQAQYLIARCHEAKGREEKAFKQYQKVLDKYPRSTNYEEVVGREYEIANHYLNGKWFKLWGIIPYRSMDRTAEMFEKVVRSGPYSDIAPQAQMRIGAAREKQRNYPLAAKAYEVAADRYNDRPAVAADALYRQGLAYQKQAQAAEYDQTTAGKAIATFTDFLTLFPNDPRGSEARETISDLKSEQARGNFKVAQFYEKSKRYRGALVYYNEVLIQQPNSPYAETARVRIDELKKLIPAGQ